MFRTFHPTKSLLPSLGPGLLASVVIAALVGRVAAQQPPSVGPGLGPAALLFVENRGQFPAEVRFMAKGRSGSVWVLDYGFVVQLLEPAALDAAPSDPRSGVNLRFTFEGAAPGVLGDEALSTRFNYFLGNDPEGWVTDAPVWESVRYESGLGLSGEAGDLRLTLGSEVVSVRVNGADGLHLDVDGALLIDTAVGAIRQTARPPEGAADGGAIRHRVPAADRYLLDTDDRSGSAVSTLAFSSFLGGNTFDLARAVGADTAGAAYVGGQTGSPDFPITFGAFQGLLLPKDGFISKLAADGESLVYSTFLGGSSFTDGLNSLAVDASGAATVAGSTQSFDFPVTEGAYDTTHAGVEGDFNIDGFVTKLDPSGSRLVYSTFVGGGDDDSFLAVALDARGRAVAVGSTRSADFSTTPNAFDAELEGGLAGCVIRLSADGSTLEYSTYFGGTSGESLHGVAIDDQGKALLAGRTGGPLGASIPVTPGAYDETFNGQTDAFVAKLDMDSGDLLYSTYLGGSSDEFLEDLAVDSTGSAIVTGWTYSASFPTTPGAFDPFYNGGSDVFVAKLSPDGGQLLFGTFLGSGGSNQGHGVAVDGHDDIVVAGFTGSSFPTTPDGYDTTHNGSFDTFVARLSADGTQLLYGTYFGGSDADRAFEVALDTEGSAYITGQTFSMDLPVTPGAADPVYDGTSSETFVYKIDFPPWFDLGFAFPGTGGLQPRLFGAGPLVGGEPMAVTLQDALPGTVAWLVVGTQVIDFFPFYGGTLVPDFQPPGGFFVTLSTDSSGSLPIEAVWPTGVPAGLALYLQYWVVDPGAAFGLSASNAIVGVAAGD